MFKPWHHQAYTIDKFRPLTGGLDLSDPGTGKTATHLALYAWRAGRGRCLVTSPMTLMETAWANDIDTFFPELTYTLAYADQRLEAFEMDSDIVIMNVDGVKALVKKFPRAEQLKKFLRDFDHLIMDEVDAYKHASSARSRAMLKVSRHIERRFGLSATPNPQSVTELHHPALIVDRGKSLGTSGSAFKYAMQEPEQVGPAANHLRWHDKPQANELAMIMLDKILVRHAFEEVMTDVPENYKEIKFVTLPPKLWQMYKQLEDTMVMALESGQYLSVPQASSLRQKLLQLCSGAIYGDGDIEGEGDYHLLDDYRYKAIADMIEESPTSVAFFNWRHQRDELVKQMKTRGISFEVIDGNVHYKKRPQIVKEYQDGAYQTLLIHYKTGGHGLTLTRGKRSFICSPIYEPNYFKQTIHRIYRGGQTDVTNTVLVCAKGTVEEVVYEKLRAGTARMEDFLKMVQEAKRR